MAYGRMDYSQTDRRYRPVPFPGDQPEPDPGFEGIPRPDRRSIPLDGAGRDRPVPYPDNPPEQDPGFQGVPRPTRRMIGLEGAGRDAGDGYGAQPADTQSDIYGLPPAPTQRRSYGGPEDYSPDLTTEDPRKMTTQDRTSAYSRGNRIDRQIQEELGYRGGLEDRYRTGMDTAYSDLEQTPGYTDEEAGNIVREPQFSSAPATEEDFSQLDPTEAERLGINRPYGESVGRMDSAIQANEIRKGQVRDALRDEGISNLLIGEGKVRGSIDREKLGLSGDFVNRFRMSDEQKQRLVNQAATTVGNEYGSAIGDLERGAAAQGNTSPLAIGAARARLENQRAAAVGDTMTNARIEADNTQAGREQNIESMRLGAEGNYASMRGAAEQGFTDKRLGLLKDLTAGQAADADQLAANRLNTAEYAGREGTNLGMTNYGIRQGNQQYRIDTRYGQGMGSNQQISSGYKDVANARREGQGEYRGYLTGQTGQAQQGQQAATTQRIQNFGTQMDAANKATGTAAEYDARLKEIKSKKPGIFDRVVGGALGAAKGFAVGGPAGAVAGGAIGAATTKK